MKATEQYFPVVPFIMLYKVTLTFESFGEILKCAMQLKATEQYFPLVFLMVVQKVVLIFCTLRVVGLFEMVSLLDVISSYSVFITFYLHWWASAV